MLAPCAHWWPPASTCDIGECTFERSKEKQHTYALRNNAVGTTLDRIPGSCNRPDLDQDLEVPGAACTLQKTDQVLVRG